MKKILLIAAILIVTAAGISEAHNSKNYAMHGYFYAYLSPYGTWIEIEPGFVVWRPTIMKRTWTPYREGRWLYTSAGWYWDSYEPFGIITYHYGRWYYDDYYGWIWILDYEWAPAWVEWRYDDVYVGWAPLPPYAVFSINIGIRFTISFFTPYYHWHFVKYRYFYDPYVYNYYIPATYVNKIYSKTKYRTNYSYVDGRVLNRGVDISYIRNRTGENIRERQIEAVRDPNAITDRKRDTDVIRTFIPSREEMTRTDLRSEEIKKGDKRSSLEISKIELGNRTNLESRNDLGNPLAKDRSSEVERTKPVTTNERERILNENTQKQRETFEQSKTISGKRESEKPEQKTFNNEVKETKPQRNVERKVESNVRKTESSSNNRIETSKPQVEQNKRGSENTRVNPTVREDKRSEFDSRKRVEIKTLSREISRDKPVIEKKPVNNEPVKREQSKDSKEIKRR
jgi:hypothetical protein